jgi:hypothetical protein
MSRKRRLELIHPPSPPPPTPNPPYAPYTPTPAIGAPPDSTALREELWEFFPWVFNDCYPLPEANPLTAGYRYTTLQRWDIAYSNARSIMRVLQSCPGCGFDYRLIAMDPDATGVGAGYSNGGSVCHFTGNW